MHNKKKYKDNTPTRRTIKRLLKQYVFKHHKIIIGACLLMVIVAACTAFSAYLMKPIINKVFVEKNKSRLVTVTMMILITFFIKAVSMYAYRVMMSFVELNIMKDLQKDLFKKVINFNMKTFNEFSPGRLVSYFSNDITLVRSAVSAIIINFAKEFATLIGLLIVMLWQNFELSLVAFIGFPLTISPVARLARKLRKISKSTQTKYEKLNTYLTDVFDGIKTVKANNTEEKEQSNFERILNNISKLLFSASSSGAVTSPLMEFMGGFAIVTVLAYGGHSVINGKSSPGSFFTFITALLLLYKPAKALSGTGIIIQNAVVALERIFNLIDKEEQIEVLMGNLEPKIDKGEIIFDKVCFTYEGKYDMALEDISFSVKKGEKIAFVGSSGSGKSTIASIILKFYQRTSGNITVDNHSIDDINTGYLRRNMAYVSQDVFLFDDTVMYNLCYGVNQCDNNEIDSALEMAQASEFVSKLPNKLVTRVGSGGSLFSGGEKQRIVIVRAILKNSPIIILDEATSALDNVAEKEVRTALDILMKDKTSIIIAHRLSTIVDCDKIYVMSEGKIIETGTHQELFDKEGMYKKMWQSQEV